MAVTPRFSNAELEDDSRISSFFYVIFRGFALKPIPIVHLSPETGKRGVHVIMLRETARHAPKRFLRRRSISADLPTTDSQWLK
jgi:hypothetical protein